MKLNEKYFFPLQYWSFELGFYLFPTDTCSSHTDITISSQKNCFCHILRLKLLCTLPHFFWESAVPQNSLRIRINPSLRPLHSSPICQWNGRNSGRKDTLPFFPPFRMPAISHTRIGKRKEKKRKKVPFFGPEAFTVPVAYVRWG